jgi:hypothetical protein
MRLDTFILADAIASPGNDGKFYVHGGGLSRFEVPTVPFPMPLDVLVRLVATDEEMLASSHSMRITLTGPAGVPNIPPVELTTGPEKSLDPILEGEPRFLQVVMSIPAQVVRLGLYHLELHVDGKKLGSIPLPVKLADDAQVVEVTPGTPVAIGPGAKPRAKTKRPPAPPKQAKRSKRRR